MFFGAFLGCKWTCLSLVCIQSRADFFLQSWFEVCRDFSPPLEAPWRNSTNWFNSCLVPLSCTHSELQKVPPLLQLRCYVTKGRKGWGTDILLLLFPPSLSHFTTVRRPHHLKPGRGEIQEGAVSLAIRWTWSLWQPDLGCKLGPETRLRTGHELGTCFFPLLHQKPIFSFGEFVFCQGLLWTCKASSGPA